MAVRKDTRDGTWRYRVVVKLPNERLIRISGTPQINTKAAAEIAEREHIQRVLSKPSVTGSPAKEVPTLTKFATEFLETYVASNNKPSEIESKRMILRRHLIPFFGPKRLDQIKQREIEAYKSRKKRTEDGVEGLSPKTINNHLTVLRKMLSLSAEWELIPNVPPVKWMKVPAPEFDFLTFEEAEKIEKHAPGEWRAMIALALATGLRLGELLALQWGDLDLVHGRVLVRRAVARGTVGTPKSGRSREVPLHDRVVQVMKKHRHLRGELVFCDMDGRMFTKGACKCPLWTACRRAELRLIGWHVLRHTFASHLAMRGAPLKAIQELLGHASIEMTMRYAHLSPDVKRDAVRLLEIRGNQVATS